MVDTTATIRAHWSSRLAFIFAAAGAAIGLGNIWKFSYEVGNNGGSAFVIVYILCLFLFAIPILLAEILIGQRAQSNSIDALKNLALEAKHSPAWQFAGWWGLLALLLIFSFYSVVAGWSLAYIYKSGTGEFSHLAAQDIQDIWQTFLSAPWQLLAWDSLFIIMTIGVVARGITNGLETATKWMMPGLFVILLILVGYAATTDGFMPALRFLFAFNPSQLTFNVILAAMGQAFFSLAVGIGVMIVYGSYLDKSINLVSTTFLIAGLDLLIALLAGLAIFPIIFNHQLATEGGPGLMFQVLPIAFANLQAGSLLGSLFFILLLFAAWTSSIAMVEPIVDMLIERFRLRRLSAALAVGALAWLLSIGSLLSFNHWQQLKLFGKWTFFDAITDFSANIMMPLGGLMLTLFVGWVMDKQTVRNALRSLHPILFNSWYFLIRFVAPVGILLIVITAIY